ncbi:hypothetical protein V8B55DRAFT_1032523 [Mucor lusitanicus]|uniref:Uncharacterized protein n=1 Tax=Mucor circinelloides f. lusitanicus TaxID=29924 RepID=A0A8H4B6G7_MUCCL|nr:hypothetical protein FB192DRAFT_1348232 [Mucor lusitanicus]
MALDLPSHLGCLPFPSITGLYHHQHPIPPVYTFQWSYSSNSFSEYFYSYLLFPVARQSIWFIHRSSPHQAFLNTLNNMIVTMGQLPRSFTTCHLDPQEVRSWALLDGSSALP